MAHSIDYADILTHVIRQEAKPQPRIQPITYAAVCDAESGQFLLIATGYENKKWFDVIVFHARLIEGWVVIELDNIEGGLQTALVAAGIPADRIISGLKYERMKTERLAA